MSDKVLLETYCINRIDRKDRWVAVRKILKNEEWKVKRFDAIIDEEAPFFWCTLSHRGIIEMAQKKNLDYVCVLEDDIIFSKQKILKEIKHLLKTAPPDWHILYLWWRLSREASLIKVKYWLYRVEWLGDAHALIYHKRSYENLLEYLPKKKTSNQTSTNIMQFKYFDHFLWFYYQKKYPCFIKNILIEQKTDFSDIQKKIRKRKYWLEKTRFFLYKIPGWRECLTLVGKILDYLRISKRELGKRSGFGLDYLVKK